MQVNKAGSPRNAVPNGFGPFPFRIKADMSSELRFVSVDTRRIAVEVDQAKDSLWQ